MRSALAILVAGFAAAGCFNADAIALKAINGLGSDRGASAVVKLLWAGKPRIEANTQGGLAGKQTSNLASYSLSKSTVGGNFNKQSAAQTSNVGGYKLRGGVNAGI